MTEDLLIAFSICVLLAVAYVGLVLTSEWIFKDDD